MVMEHNKSDQLDAAPIDGLKIGADYIDYTGDFRNSKSTRKNWWCILQLSTLWVIQSWSNARLH